MFELVTRFRKELLNASIGLNTSDIAQEHAAVITVTSKLIPARILFGLVFLLPCGYLLSHVLKAPSFGNLAVALVFCPALILMGLLIGCTTSRKTIDRYRQVSTQSLQLFSFVTEESEPLAQSGTITLSWRWSKSGDQTKGYHVYTINVSPGNGLVFTTFNDYRGALDFAERLEKFLSFALENTVPPEYRSQA